MTTDDVRCPRCGTLSAAGARLCMGCGGTLPAEALVDAPTQAQPAVSIGHGEADGERPTETFAAQPTDQQVAAPPLVPPPVSPPPLPPRRRRQVLKLSYAAAGAGLALLVIAALLVVSQLGELLGRQPAEDRGAPPSAAATTDAQATPANGASPACDAQSIAAPDTGAWRMATRRGDITLGGQGNATRLLLRIYRAGSTDDAASVSVESLAAAEVESRYGSGPPGGAETALAVSFSPEFRMSGRSFELGRVGAVDGVLIASTDNGIVGLIGLRDSGCFTLRAPGWEDGSSDRSADIIIDVER